MVAETELNVELPSPKIQAVGVPKLFSSVIVLSVSLPVPPRNWTLFCVEFVTISGLDELL